MSIVREVERGLALLLLAVLLGLGGWSWLQTQRADKAQENYQVANGNAAAATTYVREYKAVEAARRKKDAEVDSVLESHRDWADAPVPDDVAGLLRNSEGTTRAVP